MVSINKPLRIVDILTSDILFYDCACGEPCYRFCKERDIDCLPSLKDPTKKLFRRDDGRQNFVEEEVDPARIVDATASIFHPAMLERFRANHLLFVFSADEFSGVVHFSDYNRPAVRHYLYGILSAFEQTLRDVLVKKGYGNRDMMKYFDERKDRYGRKSKRYRNRQAEWDKLPPFQAFELVDLIGLLSSLDIMKISKEIVQLRHGVMHIHELVNMVDPSTPDFIFDFASFETFFGQAMDLHHDFRRAGNRLAFLSAES